MLPPAKTSGPLRWKRRFGMYEVVSHWSASTPFRGTAFRIVEGDIETARLDDDGTLHLLPGFLSDGASGPTWEPEATLPAWAAHDAFWEAARLRRIPFDRGLIDRMSSWCVWALAWPRWPKGSWRHPTWLAKLRCEAYEEVLISRLGEAAAAPDDAGERVYETP